MRRLYIFTVIFLSPLIFAFGQSQLNLSFERADSIAESYPRHSLHNLEYLAKLLTDSLSTETEKFRSIYFWVCHNIENDYYLFEKNNRMRKRLQDNPPKLREWNRKFSRKVFKHLIEDYKTMCTGYAFLVKELSNHAGIQCEIVNGYGRTSTNNIGGRGFLNHSWNAVKLEEKWYLSDPTWSSGYVLGNNKTYVHEFANGYFLSNPDLFWRNHYPKDTTWLLTQERPSLSTFLNAPLIYRDAFELQVSPNHPDQFEVAIKKGETVKFSFEISGHQTNEPLELSVVNDPTSPAEYPDLVALNETNYQFELTFPHKGKPLVHVFINNRAVFSYQAIVR